MTFRDKLIAGDVTIRDIDDFIDTWHASSQNCPLHEFLGLSQEEYAEWLKDSASLTKLCQSA
jgi:hypothetical protein